MKAATGMRYSIIVSDLEIEGWVCESYGIALSSEDREVLSIPDVSPDESRVRYMVDLFNEECLAGEHLLDVIEDMLP